VVPVPLELCVGVNLGSELLRLEVLRGRGLGMMVGRVEVVLWPRGAQLVEIWPQR
jgi:hypothetical protein